MLNTVERPSVLSYARFSVSKCVYAKETLSSPFRIRTVRTEPSDSNKWHCPEMQGNCGFGCTVAKRPWKSPGITPDTTASWSTISSNCGLYIPCQRGLEAACSSGFFEMISINASISSRINKWDRENLSGFQFTSRPIPVFGSCDCALRMDVRRAHVAWTESFDGGMTTVRAGLKAIIGVILLDVEKLPGKLFVK